MFKVILIGSSSVGKTCIINKYVKNIFSVDTKTTIGVDFSNKLITKDEICGNSFARTKNEAMVDAMLQIWDTAG